MISVDEALQLTLALAGPARAEDVPVRDALGRVLLGPAAARLTQPPFDTAMMDGYAAHSGDLPGRLPVVGEVAAGHPHSTPHIPGTALRIFTGAHLPPGCDTVIMQEDAQRAGDHVTLPASAPLAHIRPKGADFAQGWSLPPGRRLSPADLGLLSAMNLTHVRVAQRPRVAILAGGDELVPPGTDPAPGQILCSNDIAVAALAHQAGADPHILPIARDSVENIRQSLESARDFDLIVTIGGASVGDHDLIGRVTGAMGMQRAFYRIAMRPGKPLVAGRLGDAALLGLPGNPVSAIVCAIIFMQPLIFRMQDAPLPDRTRKARLAIPLPPEGPRRHYLRARLAPGTDLPLITPFPQQDSGQMRTLSEADCLLIRDAHDPARQPGAIMSFLPLHNF